MEWKKMLANFFSYQVNIDLHIKTSEINMEQKVKIIKKKLQNQSLYLQLLDLLQKEWPDQPASRCVNEQACTTF